MSGTVGTIDAARSQQYTTNVEHLVQQKKSRLRSTVTEDSYTGKAGVAVEQFDAGEVLQQTTRNADTPVGEVGHDKRWVYPKKWHRAWLIDDLDKAQMLIDPTSPYAERGAMAINRKIDDRIINAFFGTAKTGENGSTSTSFSNDGGQTVAVTEGAAAATGLNVDKLIKAREHLLSAEVDIESDPLYMAITAKQSSNLLREIRVVSKDYGEPVLKDGMLDKFLNFNFIHSERLGTDSNSYRRVPAWAKSGMHLGWWGGIKGRISERDDKSFATQVYVEGYFDATRLEGKKVVEILCAEA